ncbi:MAG: hypothetical protein M1826_004694 [Phylliscum demangeonii]|nr:MAG: hypothetical protein M1826_004694 [Phylliscum demangeonii]
MILKLQGVWMLVNGNDREARNASAFTTLASTMEDSTFRTIQNMDDVTEAWKKLKVIYKPPGSRAFYCLMKEAMTLKMEGRTVESLAQRIENLWDDLCESAPDGETLPRSLKISILLMALPADYAQTAMMIEGNTGIMFNHAVSLLRNESLRRLNVNVHAATTTLDSSPVSSR